MRKVIVFGSLNMDLSIESDHMPTLGETIIGHDFITNPGGKGANQAVAAAKLGAQVVMLGTVGEDAFGSQMIDALVTHGVQCDYVSRTSKHPTGVALITRVQGNNFITIDSGANFSTTTFDIAKALDEIANPGDVFLCQLECDFDTTMKALVDAHKCGLYTVLNPAPAKKLPAWVLPYLDLVVVNEIECEMLTGIYPVDEESARLAMEKLTDEGVGTVVITLGERGSMVQSQGRMIVEVPPAVQVVDTTCAGDTYIGALVAAYARELSIDAAADLANRASAFTTTKVGAQQSIPSLDEL